jgi:hypothetical protein
MSELKGRRTMQRRKPMPEDIIIATLCEKNVPITNESYATLAYWRSYQKLNEEERLGVREAVREATMR